MLGQSSNLRPNLGAQSPRTRLSEEPFPTAGSCPMYHPPPCRGRSLLDGKKVLLIDEKQTTRDTRANVLRGHGVEVDAADSLQRARTRANVLRGHGVEVDAADSLQRARVLWRPRRYDLILLDVRGHLPGEALEFYEQIREVTPRQLAFLVGPPLYLSLTWPGGISLEEASRGQWEQTVKRFARAA